MGAFSAGLRVLLVILSISSLQGSRALFRARRDIGDSSSLLTVEWEGIQSGDHPDSAIGGFAVEYRAEKDTQWHVHDGIIPYKGPNLQYRVQIPRLPTGVAYFVRIKVLSKDGRVLVETPEIRAKSETVNISCNNTDEPSAPRNVERTHTSQRSVAFRWEPPECGSVGEYNVELTGVDEQYEVHRQTVTHPSVSVTNLLPGTKYSFRVRAVDRSRHYGPWIKDPIVVTTLGEAPEESGEIEMDYRTDSELRIHWQPYDDERLQYYEVMAAELNHEGRPVERLRLNPMILSHVFGGLLPNTEYRIGVVAVKDVEPKRVYKLTAETTSSPGKIWEEKPTITREGPQHFSVHWKKPDIEDVHNFILEYRLPNETDWRKYGSVLVDEDTEDYQMMVDGLDDKMFYSIRILTIDYDKRVIAKTAEMNVGVASSESCAGEAGVPTDVRIGFVSENTIKFVWEKPKCDETYGPIDGYEYLYWNVEAESQPEGASYVGRNAVAISDLKPDVEYAFRVRSRAGHGHSPWSEILHANTKSSSVSADEGNIYQLRVILSPPNSYLVWTPLPEHEKDVAKFKLSLKKTLGDDWTHILQPPDYFSCPDGVADPQDYCYELSDLDRGVQYTADLTYEKTDGEWSPRGNPILFILVEAGEPTVPSSPNNLQISPRDTSSIELRWLPPLSSVHIPFYKITVEDLHSGQIKIEEVPGTYFAHVISQLSPYSTYNISVSARNERGEFGPAASKVFSLQGSEQRQSSRPSTAKQPGASTAPTCAPDARYAQYARTSVCSPLGRPGIEQPRIEQIGSRIMLYWTVGGDTRNIGAYQIDLRSESDREWRPHPSLVPHIPSERRYRHELTGLSMNGRYYVQVSALDRSRRPLVRSDAASFTVRCQAPSAAPQDVRLENHPSGVRLSWSFNNFDSPECFPKFRITGYQNGSPMDEEVDGRVREKLFTNNIGGEWRLQVIARNSAGYGPSSAPAYLRSTPQALVSTPRVTARGDTLLVEWRSEGQGRDVHSYSIQYKTDDTNWNTYGTPEPYVGDNRDYRKELSRLEFGKTYHVHIQVLDRNSYELYTSPTASARTECSEPSHPPSHVQAVAPDSRHVQVRWTPPPQSAWNCDRIQIEVHVTEPRTQTPVVLDGRQSTHVFESEADKQWTVRVRTINSAGASPFSPSVSARTPPVGELIIGPNVEYHQGIPSITWTSKPNVDDLVSEYRVEWSSEHSNRWEGTRNTIPYTGWQRGYKFQLDQLAGAAPSARNYQVRVHVIDANNAIAYTSPVVNIQIQQRCSAPRRPPSDLQAIPIGPTRIRVTWTPLHESEWNCDRVWYKLQYRTRASNGVKDFVSGENSFEFESDPSTEWTFLIQAGNQGGQSSWSRPVTGRTQSSAPGPISDLRIYPMSSKQLQITWRPPQHPHGEITGYEVTYQLLSRGMCGESIRESPITKFSGSPNPSYVLDGLHPHSKYLITVAARTDVAGERVTQEANTAEDVPAEAPLYITTSEVLETEVHLNWQAPPCLQTNGEIVSYDYEVRASDTYSGAPVVMNSVRSTRARITGLAPFTRYSTRVRANTRMGPGPWSRPLQFQTAAPVQVTPPDVQLVEYGDDKTLVWKNQPYVDRYKCRYGPAGSNDVREKVFPAENPCPPSIPESKGLPPPYSQYHCGRIDGLDPRLKYDIEVSACPPAGGCSPPSSITCGGEQGVEVISIQKIGGSDTSLDIGWRIREQQTPVSGFVITLVAVDQSRDPHTHTNQVDGSTWNSRVTNLRPDTKYRVNVRAIVPNAPSNAGLTVEMSTEAGGLALTKAPRVIFSDATSVTIEWDSPDRRVPHHSFVVEFRLDNGIWQTDPTIIEWSNAPTFTHKIKNLPTDSVVDLRYRIRTLKNVLSDASPDVRARTRCVAPTSPPHGFRVDALSTNEVRVTWAIPGRDSWQCDHLSFEIEYASGNSPKKVIPVSGDQNEYIFRSEANTRWVFRIRSTNQVGSSPWSPEQVVTTRQGAPGKVRDLRFRPKGPNEIYVQWLAPLLPHGTIVGYDITYRLLHKIACPDEEPKDASRDYITIYNHKNLDYTLTGLLPFSRYEIRVRARTTELGPEEIGTADTEQKPPSGPPLNLVNSHALERSLIFQWEPVECSQRHGHIISYEYHIQGQDGWAKLENQYGNVTATSDSKAPISLTIEGLTPFTKYVMTVKAYNSIGGGPDTENLDVMTKKADAPLAPQDLILNVKGTNFFLVSWLPPYPPYGPHDAYKIEYQLANATTWKKIEVDIDDSALDCLRDDGRPSEGPRLCYEIKGLESDKRYLVRVAARIEGGSYGPWSQILSGVTLEILPDAPIAIKLVEKTDRSLHIEWVPPPDPMGHIVRYKVGIRSTDDPNDQWRHFFVDHPTLHYIFGNLQPETLYNISLAAGTKQGFGPEISTRYSTAPFKVPNIMRPPKVVADGAHSLIVEWDGVIDAKGRISGYILEIRSSGSPSFTEYGEMISHEAAKRTYSERLSNLEADTLYFVRVKVVDTKQRLGEPSPEASARTGCAAPRSPPINLIANSPSPYQVRVSWQAPIQSSWMCTNIKYTLEFRNGTAPAKQVQLESTTTEQVLDSAPNTKWIVRVRIDNAAGSSDWSEELTVTTGEGAPGIVDSIEADTTGPSSAVVTWEPPKEPNGQITGYTVTYQLKSRGECGPRTAQPFVKNVQSEKIELDGLLPDSTYEVFITAHTLQPGPQSKPVTFTTEEAAPTGPPLHVRVTSVTQTRADLIWSEPDCELRNGKITEYEYQLESLNDWAQNRSGHIMVHRVSFDELIPYTRYRARVRAKNSQGDGPFSEWVTFQTLPAAPPPPTDLAEEQSFPHAIEMSFLPPSPPHGIIERYKIRHTPAGQLNYKEVVVPVERLECSDFSKKDRLCYRVVNLDPEQGYEIQAAAHTERGGWSVWSDSLSAQTHMQKIPVLERALKVIDTKPTSIKVRWEGLDAEQAAHVVGYVLEYKSGDNEDDWKEYNGIIKHRGRHNVYDVTVKNLEPATEYFFRLRVVGKNNKRGSPGPEAKGVTNCGRPEEPPTEVKLEAMDFETVKLKWKSPDSSSWNCDEVEYVVDFVNTTSRGVMTVPVDLDELILTTMPGTKWEIKMRTQTVEEGRKSQHSPWSDRVSLITPSLPGEIFVSVEPNTPHSAILIWDLADQDQKWNYGVDVTYRLVQLGGCVEAKSGDHEPVTKLNVQDKKILLDDLKPGSEYEVIVTPRKPPSLHSSIKTPKTVRRFRLESTVPAGPPRNLRSDFVKDTEIGFKWESPACEDQNGMITQYEYELTGAEEWNAEDRREGITPRMNAVVDQLRPGSLYNIRVRAYTAAGEGPWTEPIKIKTTGSELGPPRDLTALQTLNTSAVLSWLPPYPERVPVVAYRLKYSPQLDDSNPVEVEFSINQLSCSGYDSAFISSDTLCATIKPLEPRTTYRVVVKAQSKSGNWGNDSIPLYITTTSEPGPIGGKLTLLSATHDSLKVNWTVPPVIRELIDEYQVYISVASVHDRHPKKYTTNEVEFHFKGLEEKTSYNITVEGMSKGKPLWHIQNVFSTFEKGAPGLLDIPPPTDLVLIEKTHKMLHVKWTPPEIFDFEKEREIDHYRVTIAPFNPKTGITGPPRNYTVPKGGNSIRFEDLTPETIYNITVQAGTPNGYGQILWGVFSTLAPWQTHTLRLVYRTPTTLTVEWEPTWGIPEQGYILSWKSLHSAVPRVRLGSVNSTYLDGMVKNFTIQGLSPSTVYNVTLQPKGYADGAWGAYATLPPGWFVVRNLKQCDSTQFAVSMNWEPVELNMASHYQVRYLQLSGPILRGEGNWIIEEEKRALDLLCPKDGCGRLCYLVFNLRHSPEHYVFQVRAKVNGEWNQWKTMGKPGSRRKSDKIELQTCCIVPPPFMVKPPGVNGTYMDVEISPVQSHRENISRYYVVVDHRDPAGDTNWTYLTDMVTASKMNIPYYVAASYNADTLTEKRTVRIGDSRVIGGYLNYPLEKNKKYNYEIYSKWEVNGVPVIARLRASPYILGGWPWWWLLLLLLLLLLLILLTCCLLWCLQGRYRTRKEHRRIAMNGQTEPLIPADAEKNGMRENMDALSQQVKDMREKLAGATALTGRGEFEDGYIRGFRDASKIGSASVARKRLEEDYASRDDRFHEGYVKGLRDAGMTGMSTSMHNLAQRGPGGGYSSGYMQGFRDGNSGVFGDRISTNLLRRLEEQYPNQEEFRTGYIDGFKEGASSRTTERRSFEESRRLQESLTKLTEILQEKSKGDEIHTTKIYHVYNQQPEGIGLAYTSSGKALERELEELTSSSRRSTLRRHYTPGDYLKYGSETDGYGSLGRNRRSLSASALAREPTERARYHSGTGTSYISRASADRAMTTDTFSRRYNYRSRSDMGSPRRYASQTLLNGARPGPSTPHIRRDALHTLQRELDTLSRSPDRSTPRGYSSDTGYMNDTIRSRARGYSNYDYDSYQANRSEMKSSSTAAAGGATSSSRYPISVPVRTAMSSSYSASRKEGSGGGGAQTSSPSSHNWPDDLIDIVNEPMGQTLDRMKKYSSSMSQVDRDGTDDGVKESVEERYQRSYKEEYSTGGR